MKSTRNPWVIQKTEMSSQRECALADIPYVIRSDGSRGCIWCGDDLKTKHPNQRYCKDKQCPPSAFMWGYPQHNVALAELLKRQGFMCNICQYDYMEDIIEIVDEFTGSIDEIVVSKMKAKILVEFRPEVDHIKAIMSGGQSLGLDNHQVICYTCHKAKTKEDFKKPKRIKKSEEIKKNNLSKIEKKYIEKSNLFYQENYKKYEGIKDNKEKLKMKKILYVNIFLGTLLTIEELEFLSETDRYDHYDLSLSTHAKEILVVKKMRLL